MFDLESAKREVDAIRSGAPILTPENLDMALLDPLEFKRCLLAHDVNSIVDEISALERLVEKAQKKIKKFSDLYTLAMNRYKRHEAARQKLSPGKPVPDSMLPAEKDIKKAIVQYKRSHQEADEYRLGSPFRVKGWQTMKMKTDSNGLRCLVRRVDRLDLSLMGIPSVPGWFLADGEFDAAGHIKIWMRKSFPRPELDGNTLLKNAMACIEKFKVDFEDGKLNSQPDETLLSFYAERDRVKSDLGQEIDKLRKQLSTRIEKPRVTKTLQQELDEYREYVRSHPFVGEGNQPLDSS